MIDFLEELIERLTVAHNIGHSLLVDDDDAFISHFQPIILDVISEMQLRVDQAKQLRATKVIK